MRRTYHAALAAAVAAACVAGSGSAAAPRDRSTGEIRDPIGDATGDLGRDYAVADIVAASARYSPASGLVVRLTLAKPFLGDRSPDLSIGVQLASASRDINTARVADMGVLDHSKPLFTYGTNDVATSWMKVSGSVVGRIITIRVRHPDTRWLAYATFYSIGPFHARDYVPNLKNDDQTWVPLRPGP